MSFGQNIQFLRKLHHGMTQEELAEKLGVTRQTISKWEQDGAYPEMDKVLELCTIFSSSMDQLIREDLDTNNPAYSEIQIKEVEGFRYVTHTVISESPEEDALSHMHNWAKRQGIEEADVIGWDFPCLSQEQINVYHMHGYGVACILPEAFDKESCDKTILEQKKQRYVVITIKEPMVAPFVLIPNAYKTLMRYIEVNGHQFTHEKNILPCFEREYVKNGVEYMDVYIAI